MRYRLMLDGEPFLETDEDFEWALSADDHLICTVCIRRLVVIERVEQEAAA